MLGSFLEFHDHILAHKGLEKVIEEHGARAEGGGPDLKREGLMPWARGPVGTRAQVRTWDSVGQSMAW